jgi:hypothetical protein
MKLLHAAIAAGVAAVALVLAAPANAATTYSVYLSDLWPSATQDSLQGAAVSDLEKASISVALGHDQGLTTIDGGSVTLKVMDKKVVVRQLTDAISGGTLTATTDPGQLCLNQTYALAATLSTTTGESAGSLSGTLTLFRTFLPGSGCWTFGGSLTGSLSLS